MDRLVLFLSFTSFCLSFFTRLPQIIRIYKVKSTVGVSAISLLLEVWNCSCSVSYAYQFGLPYIEYAVNLMQTYIIFALYFRYSHTRPAARLLCILLICVILHTLVIFKITSPLVATLFMYTSLPLAPLSRILQILNVYHCQSSGSLSSLTYILQSVCVICRLLRVSLISSDRLMILKLSSMSLCNVALALVILKYTGEKAKSPNKEKHIN